MKTVTLTEEQFTKAADELISTIAKDDPIFGFTLVMAYKLLMTKIFYEQTFSNENTQEVDLIE